MTNTLRPQNNETNQPADQPAAGALGAGGARAAQGGRPDPRRAQPRRARGQRRGARNAAPGAARVLRATGIPVAETFMGKGLLPPDSPKASARSAFSRATTRWPASTRPTSCSRSATTSSSTRPSTGTRAATRRSSASTRCPAEIDEYFMPEVELVGDIYHVLTRLGEECRHVPHPGGSTQLREVVLGRFERPRTTTPSRCSRRAPSARCARRSGARTSWSRTSACTSCGSGACSRPTSRTRC